MRNKIDISNMLAKYRTIITVLIFIIIFLGINLLRLSASKHFPTNESYIFLNNYNSYNDFSYKGINLFYEITIELGFIFGEQSAILIVLFAFGIINVLLFSNIAGILVKKRKEQLLTNIFFIISILFLSSISTFSYLPAIITMILWTFLFFLRRSNLLFVPLIFSMFIDSPTFILNLILIISLLIISKITNLLKDGDNISVKKFININIIMPIIIFILLYSLKYISLQSIFLSKINYTWIINELGTIYGISLLYLILAIFAFFTSIKNKKLRIIIILVMIASFFNFYIGIIFMIIVIILAALGIKHINSRKWFIKELKKPTTFLIILLILFSTISFGKSIVVSEPTNNFVNDIKLMGNFSMNNFTHQRVLCDKKDCELLKYFSKDDIFDSNYKDNKNYNKTNFILRNGNLKIMNKFFVENNISTVFISEDTLHRRWSRADEGILLLLTQSDKFIKLENTSESLVYFYVDNNTAFQR